MTRPSQRLYPPLGAAARVACVCACILAAGAVPASAFAPQSYCVQAGSSATDPCPASGFDQTFISLNDAMNAIAVDGAVLGITGDTVTVEPGAYDRNGGFTVDGQTGVTIQGDPGKAPPVISSSDGTVLHAKPMAGGLTLRHVDIDATDTGTSTLPALQTDSSVTLDRVTIETTIGCAKFDGGVTASNVTVTAPAPVGSPNAGTCVELGGSSPNATLDKLTVNAPAYLAGLKADPGSADITIDHSNITALAPASEGSGALMLVLSQSVTVKHSVIAGGSFAVWSEGSAPLSISDSLLTSEGKALDGPVIGLGASPAALITLFGPNTTSLRNVTAIAGGTTSVGLEASDAFTLGSTPFPSTTLDVSNSVVRGTGQDVTSFSPPGASSGRGTIDISYSNYRQKPGDGSVAGTGDEAGDPLFVDGTLGPSQDFHVLAGSPVIDSGTAVPAGTTDLDGHPRPDVAGSRPDQGAYESSLTRQPPVCDAGAASSTLGQPVRITFGCTSSPPLTSSYAVASEPAHGTLSDLDAANGAVTYTPAAGFTGTDTFTYGATNDAGSVTTTVTVTVKPVVPVLTAVHQTHRRWRRGLLQATIARRSRKAPLGTRFTFGLNESAGVTLTFTAIQKHRAGKKHKRVRPAGTLSFTGHPGDNTVAFYGPISPTHTLARGRYTVAIVASTTAGSARPVILRFTVVR